MKLEEYSNLDEKDVVFKHIVVDTKEDLEKCLSSEDCKISEHYEGKQFIYRGVNEAKYKMYTSAQREWIVREWERSGITFIDFIASVLNGLKKNNFFNEFYKSMNVIVNDLLCMAFLQHYGAPAPLLDFTTDINKALYFATEDFKYPVTGSDSIDNYISLYVLKLNNYVPSIDELLYDGIKNGKIALENFFKEYPNIPVNAEILERINKLIEWKAGNGVLNETYKFKVEYIPNPNDMKPVKSILNERLFYSNPNIIAQSGCFILNTSEKQPLEEYIHSNDNVHDIVCLDIHKSLCDYIKKSRLAGISRSTLFPDFNETAKQSYNAFKECLK